MKNILSKIFDLFKLEEQEIVPSTPNDIAARFELSYKRISIGFLTLDKGVWTFVYSEEFKRQSEITPITDFPHKEKEYQSNTLFPFFAFRIPSQQRIKIQKLASSNAIEDEVQLLKKFGRQSIANPYQLLSTV